MKYESGHCTIKPNIVEGGNAKCLMYYENKIMNQIWMSHAYLCVIQMMSERV